MTDHSRTPHRLALPALLVYLAFVIYQTLADGGAWQCGGTLLAFGGRLSRSDMLANLVAYAPLGLLGVIVAGRPRWSSGHFLLRAALLGVVLPATLSLGLEVIQSCQASRVSSAVDLVTNVAGAVCGAAAALLLTLPLGLSATSRDSKSRLRLLTVGVAVAWVVSQTMPWVFAVDVGTVRSNLSFLRGWSSALDLDGWRLLRHTGAWVAIACACRLAGGEARRAALALGATAAASVGLQLLLDARSPLSFEELAGMLVGIGLSAIGLAMGRRWTSRAWAVTLFLAATLAVAAYELRPDPSAPVATGRAFSWWPRVGLGGLAGAIDYALLFGWFGLAVSVAAQWAERAGLQRAGRLWPVVAVVTMLALEIAQTRIPGRGPDISAPLFTLLALLTVSALARDTPPPDER